MSQIFGWNFSQSPLCDKCQLRAELLFRVPDGHFLGARRWTFLTGLRKFGGILLSGGFPRKFRPIGCRKPFRTGNPPNHLDKRCGILQVHRSSWTPRKTCVDESCDTTCSLAPGEPEAASQPAGGLREKAQLLGKSRVGSPRKCAPGGAIAKNREILIPDALLWRTGKDIPAEKMGLGIPVLPKNGSFPARFRPHDQVFLGRGRKRFSGGEEKSPLFSGLVVL